MPSDSHSVVVLISVQAILPHCGSLLGSLVMTARRLGVAVRGQDGIDLTASCLTIVALQSLVIQIQTFNNISLLLMQGYSARVRETVFVFFKLT